MGNKADVLKGALAREPRRSWQGDLDCHMGVMVEIISSEMGEELNCQGVQWAGECQSVFSYKS